MLRSAARYAKRLIQGPPPEIREPEIPPQEINFNSGGGVGYAEYARLFKEKACVVDVPLLIEKAGLTPSSSILDYGCGMGRLTYAMGKYLSDEGSYYGYEINPVGLEFLRSAYRHRPNFHFDGQPLHFEEDYVAGVQNTRHQGTISASEVDLTQFITQPVDIQWSASVFTHMWVDPIIHVLNSLKRVVKPGGICINSWFMIDDRAAYVLKCGLADRSLPYCIDRAHTYSETNPLVCTAYEKDTILKLYDRAGHEIIEITPGWWAGGAPKHHPQQQDIVISKF